MSHAPGPMTPEQMKLEIARLMAENAALTKKTSTGMGLKVSAKGALSLYGLGRFPITLYKSQWLKLLAKSEDIGKFIMDHSAELVEKADKEETKAG